MIDLLADIARVGVALFLLGLIARSAYQYFTSDEHEIHEGGSLFKDLGK